MRSTADRDVNRRRSVATVCLSGTLDDKLVAASHAGFDGIELFESDLIASPFRPAEVAARVAELGMTIDLYQPFRDAEAAPQQRFRQTLRRFERKVDVMTQLGTDTVLVCSSVAPDTVRDDDLAADQLRQLAEVAALRGCRVAYEALAWGAHVSTWTHAWEIVAHADHPALGLCLDSFHISSLGTALDRLREVPADKLFFVQLADAPQLSMEALRWSRHHRVFPGQGSFDLVNFTRAVLAAGYDGPLSLEVFNDVFRQADPKRTAVDAYRSLLVLEDAVQTVCGNDNHHELAVLPPAPSLDGFGFVELAVDAVSGPILSDALSTLGFTHTGQHRTKPVQLWEQGGARILLNAIEVRVERSPCRAGVSAIAVESADPPASAARAEALLATRVQHRHGRDEIDLATVLAPDGTELVFGKAVPSGDTASWSTDFLPTGFTSWAQAPLTKIDHVALSQPFDHFEEAGLFYRSVLELIDDAAGELAAPYGLVRTHAVRDPARTVRIGLSVALLRRGVWAPDVPSPQHVAFATDDLFAAMAALRELGAPLLTIPENYYDDLEARFELAPAMAAALRAEGALYDRDADGEFLHCYTELLGSRVFFEIVQRVGGYNGYGAINAPVRMAAHRAARLAGGTDELL